MKYLEMNEDKRFIFGRYLDKGICIGVNYSNLFIPDDLDDQDYIEGASDIIEEKFDFLYDDHEITYESIVLLQAEISEEEISDIVKRGFMVYLPTGSDVFELAAYPNCKGRDISRTSLSFLKDLHPLPSSFESAENTMTLMKEGGEVVLILATNPSEVSNGIIPLRHSYPLAELWAFEENIGMKFEEGLTVGIVRKIYDVLGALTDSSEDSSFEYNVSLYSLINNTSMLFLEDAQAQKELAMCGIRRCISHVMNNRESIWDDYSSEQDKEELMEKFDDIRWARYYIDWLSANDIEFYELDYYI